MLSRVKHLKSMKPTFRSFLRSGWQHKVIFCEFSLSCWIPWNIYTAWNLCLDPSFDHDDNISFFLCLGCPVEHRETSIQYETYVKIIPAIRITSKVVVLCLSCWTKWNIYTGWQHKVIFCEFRLSCWIPWNIYTVWNLRLDYSCDQDYK